MQNKAELRQKIKSTRQELSIQEQANAALKLCKLIQNSSYFNDNQNFAFYFANNAEVNPAELFSRCWQLNKNVYLPVLDNNNEGKLVFVRYEQTDSLIMNKYNILEPDINKPHIDAKDLDIIFMPLVAFDRNGNRLGMGKGYYDKTLAELGENRPEKPKLIGLAYKFQEVENIEADEWDVKLDAVVTDEEIIEF